MSLDSNQDLLIAVGNDEARREHRSIEKILRCNKRKMKLSHPIGLSIDKPPAGPYLDPWIILIQHPLKSLFILHRSAQRDAMGSVTNRFFPIGWKKGIPCSTVSVHSA